MILVGYTWWDVGLGTLYVSLGLLVLFILYKRLLARLSRGAVDKKDYCVLYALEDDPATGDLEFYFTSGIEREVVLSILDADMKDLKVVAEKTATPGGNIVRFDSTTLSNGEYYFCLKTENQKTMKKMRVLNR